MTFVMPQDMTTEALRIEAFCLKDSTTEHVFKDFTSA
ncbi:MAG: hypothetical protein ACJAUG_002376 [Halioglobus sp.]|jgi:hypothetical protein